MPNVEYIESPSMSGMSSQSPAQNRACHQVYSGTILPPPSFPTRPGSPILIGSSSEGSPTAEDHVPLWACEELTNHRQVISIDTLPDDVLLEIFNSHGYDYIFQEEREKVWQRLVHVCRRWRSIVFGSPRHLSLQLVCRTRTPTRDMLDVWPAFPLVIESSGYPSGSMDNIIAALGCTDRVHQISLRIDRSLSLDILWTIQYPFLELTRLVLYSNDNTVPAFPDSFLGGSAPRLESLLLYNIPFPGLPRLLLSATHLVDLHLSNIPHSGYFSPDGMVAALSTMTSLKSLTLVFESPRSCPDPSSQRPPPKTRSVLPVLTSFEFRGVSEYLEDLVACIDAPQLSVLDIIFFYDIELDTSQLTQFINRTSMSRAPKEAHITLQHDGATVDFSLQPSGHPVRFNVKILCKGLDWQLSSLEQVCTSCLPPLSMLEDLYFHEGSDSQPNWKDSVESGQWLELFRSFMTVENLYLSEKLASSIAPALQELIEGRTTDVLPALQNIFLKGLDSSGFVQESIGRFVAARQAANHPISISPWTDSYEGEVY